MVKNLFDRYIWLVDTIYRAGRITYEEINRKWLRTDWSEDKDLRTLPLHTSQQEIEVNDEYSVSTSSMKAGLLSALTACMVSLILTARKLYHPFTI